MRARPAAERFWEKVDAGGVCWQWMASVNHFGYGHFWPRHGHKRMAHRYAYESLVGDVPDGLELDHLCRNRGCVNPDHLEPVTRQVNVLRGGSPAAIHARKRQCPQGHGYHQYPNGRRECRVCMYAARKKVK